MESAVSIQKQVKTYLAETGRKKKWLAAQLDISPSTLSQWLMGKSAFSESRLCEIQNIIKGNK